MTDEKIVRVYIERATLPWDMSEEYKPSDVEALAALSRLVAEKERAERERDEAREEERKWLEYACGEQVERDMTRSLSPAAPTNQDQKATD